MKRLVITGYRQHELGIFNEDHPGIYYIKKALQNHLTSFLQDGLEWVIVSGQLGVETWAVEVVIHLQEFYPQLKYAVITPFKNQDQNWNETNKEKHQFVIDNADYVTSLTAKPYEAPWQFIEKDKFLLRNSDGLLILYDTENDGSPKFMKKTADQYAKKSNYQVITITQDDLQVIVEEEQIANWDFE